MLGVPRPTLYRYLKEYPIPFARRSGRIRIPADSLDGIRKVREMHDEGLGTEAVRRRLSDEGSSLEVRLDRISETLEDLRRGNSGYPSEVIAPASGDMRTLLARQALLISAVFDMSKMLEELLTSTGHPRKTTFEGALQEGATDEAVGILAMDLPPMNAITGTLPDTPAPDGAGNFGVLAQRRRRILLACVLLAVLAAFVLVAGIQLV